jgi:hypothetical protein
MSSPFAQKFMGKRPFSDEQYENLAKKYAKKEKEQSVENNAPDYETRIRLQEELAKELEQKKQKGSSSPNQMSPLNQTTTSKSGSPYGQSSGYVSIQPALQNLHAKMLDDKYKGEGLIKHLKDKKTNKKTKDSTANSNSGSNVSKPTEDLSKKIDKYNTFQDTTRVASVDGNLMRIDGKGNMYSMKFDELGKKVFDMDEVSKGLNNILKR